MTQQHPVVPPTFQIHCRIEVVVTDPQAITDRAVAELRSADIDWSTEEDGPESAVRELCGDLPLALAGLVDVPRLVDGVPGVEFRGGHCWVEPTSGRDVAGSGYAVAGWVDDTTTSGEAGAGRP